MALAATVFFHPQISRVVLSVQVSQMARDLETTLVGSGNYGGNHPNNWHSRRHEAGRPTHPSEEPVPRPHLNWFHHQAYEREASSSSSRRSRRRSSQAPPPPPTAPGPRVPQPLDNVTIADVYQQVAILQAQHRSTSARLNSIERSLSIMCETQMEILSFLKPDLPDAVMDDDPNEPRWGGP